MSGLAWLAQRQLECAIARGEFNEFEGKGKPFRSTLFGNPHEGEWELAHHLLRQADLAPRWIELDKEVRGRRHTFREWLSVAIMRGGEEIETKLLACANRELYALNEQIELRNQLAPDAVRPLFRLQLQVEIERAWPGGLNQQADHEGRPDR
jgi:hypothetical protein